MRVRGAVLLVATAVAQTPEETTAVPQLTDNIPPASVTDNEPPTTATNKESLPLSATFPDTIDGFPELQELNFILELAKQNPWRTEFTEAFEELDTIDSVGETPKDVERLVQDLQTRIASLGEIKSAHQKQTAESVKSALAILNGASDRLGDSPNSKAQERLEVMISDIQSEQLGREREMEADTRSFLDKTMEITDREIISGTGDLESRMSKILVLLRHLTTAWNEIFASTRADVRISSRDVAVVRLKELVQLSFKLVGDRKKALVKLEDLLKNLSQPLNALRARDHELHLLRMQTFRSIQEATRTWAEMTKRGLENFVRLLFDVSRTFGVENLTLPSKRLSMADWERALARGSRLLRLVEAVPEDSEETKLKKVGEIKAIFSNLQRAQKVQTTALRNDLEEHLIKAEWMNMVVQIHPGIPSSSKAAKLRLIDRARDKYMATRTFLLNSVNKAFEEFKETQSAKGATIMGDTQLFSVMLETKREDLLDISYRFEASLDEARTFVANADVDGEMTVRDRQRREKDFIDVRKELQKAISSAHDAIKLGWDDFVVAYKTELSRLKDNEAAVNDLRKSWDKLTSERAKFLTSSKTSFDFVISMIDDEMEATKAAAPVFENIPEEVPPPFVEPTQPVTGAAISFMSAVGFAQEFEGICQAEFELPIVIEKQDATDLVAPVEKRRIAMQYLWAKVRLLTMLRQRRNLHVALGESEGISTEAGRISAHLTKLDKFVADIGATCS